jgi:hypothetical protein
MKKLTLNELADLGGWPFTLNDLRYMDNGIRDALAMLCNSLLPNSGVLVLSGCNLTGTLIPDGINVSEGIVLIDNEICKFEPQVLTVEYFAVGTVSFWDTVTTYDPEGASFFIENPSVAINTYAIKKAKISYVVGSLPVGKVGFLEEKRLGKENSWIEATPSGVWIFSGNTKYRVTLDGYIECYFSGGASDNNALIFALPVGFRPNKKYYFTAIMTAGNMIPISVETNGNVSAVGGTFQYGLTGGVPTYIYQGYFKFPLIV